MFDAVHPNADVARQLERIYGLHRKFVDFRLERSPFEVVLETLGSPHKKLRNVIHFAGTNGKGSTLAFTRAILEAAGYSVNSYTSPHLFYFNERIRLGKTLIDDNKLLELIARIDKASKDTPLTFFEYTSILSFLAMSESPADFTLLETGMGGRMDCTNIVPDKLLTVITGIALDHTDFLGTSLAGIAKEKAGILRQNTVCIIAPQNHAADVLPAIEEVAGSLQAPLILAGKDYKTTKTETGFIYEDAAGGLTLPEPALRGAHQLNNAATSVAAARQLAKDFALNDAAIACGIGSATWRGRLDAQLSPSLLAAKPAKWEMLYDGAHNLDGAEALAKYLSTQTRQRQVALIVAQAADKDLHSFLQRFSGLVSHVVFTDLTIARNPQTADEMLEKAVSHTYGFSLDKAATPLGALEVLKEALNTDRSADIIICGSLYLAASVLSNDVS